MTNQPITHTRCQTCGVTTIKDIDGYMAEVQAESAITHEGKTYYPDANGWYPIETMPKGQRVLLYSDGGNIYAGEWAINPITDDEQISIGALGDGRKAIVLTATVTHWRPDLCHWCGEFTDVTDSFEFGVFKDD